MSSPSDTDSNTRANSSDQAGYDREFDGIASNYGNSTEHPLGSQESGWGDVADAFERDNAQNHARLMDTDPEYRKKHYEKEAHNRAVREGANRGGNGWSSPSTPARSHANTGNPASSGSTGQRAKAVSGVDLKKKEEEPDRSRFSAADDMREKLGLGYTGKGSNKSKLFSNLYSSNSAFKKKIAIAGAAAGGSLVVAIFVFLAMLPLKIETMINGIEAKESAMAQNAVGTESENLLNKYIATRVLPALNAKNCHSTIDAKCVALTGKENGPIGKLFTAWKQQGIEHKLATKYNIVFGANGGGSRNLYMTIDGVNAASGSDLEKVMKDPANNSIFDLGSDDKKNVSRKEVRAALKNAFKDASLWDKTYFRFKVGKLMETKYGVKRCWIACNQRDKFADKVADKKLAAKSMILRRVLTPLSENYSLVMQCVMTGSEFCKTALDPAQPGDEDKMSPVQKKVQQQVVDFAAQFGADRLPQLVQAAEKISSDGLGKYIAGQAANKLIGLVGGDAAGEVAGQAAEKAVPVVGWALLIGQIAAVASTIGPTLQYLGYAANTTAAVQMYGGFQTVASEVKSAHMDVSELGSFNDALTYNTDPKSGDRIDATQTPMYASMFGDKTTTTTASILTSFLPSTAYADSTSKSPYKCNDGKGVPGGKLVCPEEVMDSGNSALSGISNFVNSIPGMGTITFVINKINSLIGSAFNAVCDITPGCKAALGEIGKLTGNIFDWLEHKLIDSPFQTTNGGRNFDMMVAGGDVINNSSCQTNLGCAQISPKEVAKQQNEHIAEEKANFDSMPLFARMFSTDTQYSLVSRMALTMPTNLVSASNTGFGSLISDPLGKLGDAFGSIFSGNHAFAASAPAEDAFGIPQMGYTSVPTDPEAYWNANCVNGPLAKYDESSDTLDISDWLNDDSNASQDENTGTLVYHKTNACQLIYSSVQSAGAMFDPSLVSKEANQDQGGGADTGGGTTSILNTSAAEAAAKSASTGNVKVGYALYDSTGKLLSSYSPTNANYGASITKAMLLVAYLNQVGSGTLSATAKTNLTAMIENSDNAASNWVYHQLSNPNAAVNKVASDAGMNGFKLDTSDPTYVLGQSTITADDFAKFFASIDTRLAGPQQNFGMDLLSHLSAADQNGLLDAGLPGTVYSKEGWKPEPSGTRGAPYIVNQAAQFGSNGTVYGIAVTVSGTTDQASGEAIVKSVATALVTR